MPVTMSPIMHLYELFASLALILVHFRVLWCILFKRFVVSIKNLDLDSEYVNVGRGPRQREVYQQEFRAAHVNFWKEEKPDYHSRPERPRLLDRF